MPDVGELVDVASAGGLSGTAISNREFRRWCSQIGTPAVVNPIATVRRCAFAQNRQNLIAIAALDGAA
jgi:hypothetical protein